MQLINRILLLLFIGFIETLMVHQAFRKFLSRNARGKMQYLFSLVIYAGCTIFDAANNFPVYFVFIFCYVLITAISFLFYDNPNEIRLIVPFVFVSLNYAATIFSTTLIWLFTSGELPQYPPNLEQNFYSQVLMYILFTLFTYLVIKVIDYKKKNNAVYNAAISFFPPLITLILIVRLFYLTFESTSEGQIINSHLTIAGLLFLTALTLFSLSDRIKSLYENLTYSATLEQMLAMQGKYYSSLQEHQLELRRINHDIRNHTRVIVNLINQGHHEEAKKYVESLSMEIRKLVSVTECNNQLIGALLNDKLGGLKESGVTLSLCVMVPAVLNINNVDLCILMGNLLDNAVDACKRISDPDAERFIDVDIRLKGPFLCINIKNAYSGTLNFDKHHYFTTKPDTLYHGIGLSNVARVVEKYDGKLTVSHSENIFTATVLLYYPYEDTVQMSAASEHDD